MFITLLSEFNLLFSPFDFMFHWLLFFQSELWFYFTGFQLYLCTYFVPNYLQRQSLTVYLISWCKHFWDTSELKSTRMKWIKSNGPLHISWLYHFAIPNVSTITLLLLLLLLLLLCDKVCQWLATGRWFSPYTSVSSTNKTKKYFIQINMKRLGINYHNL
jgi:hypothetical protein